LVLGFGGFGVRGGAAFPVLELALLFFLVLGVLGAVPLFCESDEADAGSDDDGGDDNDDDSDDDSDDDYDNDGDDDG